MESASEATAFQSCRCPAFSLQLVSLQTLYNLGIVKRSSPQLVLCNYTELACFMGVRSAHCNGLGTLQCHFSAVTQALTQAPPRSLLLPCVGHAAAMHRTFRTECLPGQFLRESTQCCWIQASRHALELCFEDERSTLCAAAQKLLPAAKQGGEPLPEGLLWLLLTGDVSALILVTLANRQLNGTVHIALAHT